MRKLGFREVKLLAQGHTAKLRAEPGPRSISHQSLLYSVISKRGVFIRKRKRLPAQGAFVRVEDETGSRSEVVMLNKTVHFLNCQKLRSEEL